jgi:hypothetical protein
MGENFNSVSSLQQKQTFDPGLVDAQEQFFLANEDARFTVYVIISVSNSKKYDTLIPPSQRKDSRVLRTEQLTAQMEHEFQNLNVPTGWAILTVDTSSNGSRDWNRT